MNRTLDSELIDNGDIPVYDAEGFYDVEVIGNVTWLLLFHIRRRASGEVYREPAFYVRIPNDAVGHAIGLTIRKAGGIITADITATAGELVKGLLLQ